MEKLSDFDLQAINIVGLQNYLTSLADKAAFVNDWRGRYQGQARAVIRPKTTIEVVEIIKTCNAFDINIVPQSGNSGLVGGAVPFDEKRSVILSLSRLDDIREIDIVNNSVTVGAGVILANLRNLAADNNRLFPVNLGASGSAQIGGLISTNAGGTEVLRYGNIRAQVLGLEVVLSDGRIWNGLRGLRKDNSGYDLKQLFIGSEGTLGIVTAAVLKLCPRPKNSTTAMVAITNPAAATRLLGQFYDTIGNRVESFELISRSQIEIVLRHAVTLSSPIPLNHDWYAMIEISEESNHLNLDEIMETILGEALSIGDVIDAVIAQNLSQADKIWEIRHSISETNKQEGFTISNDTSVPVSRQPVFLEQVNMKLRHVFPEAHINFCGHLGDGNVHVIVVFPHGHYESNKKEELSQKVNRIVHMKALELGGSIAAEHGIGRMHVQRLKETKDTVSLDLMRLVKTIFDPDGRLNPGNILKDK